MSPMRYLLLGILPAFALTAVLAQPPTEGKKVALLIGVNEYANRKLDNLKYAERDVTDLAATLKNAGFTVRTLRGGDGITDRTNGQQAYFAALNDVLKGIGKKDVVLLGFSGHGQQLLLKDREVPFYCPRDAVPTDPTTLISLNDVLTALDEKGGGHNLLLVDACRNIVDENKGARSGINGRRIDNLPEGTAVFFACSGRQKARETDRAGGGHGVFFHFVLEGLKGAEGARDTKDQVTWERLVPYVKEQVKAEFPNWFAGIPDEERQIPFAIGSLGDVPPLVAKLIPREDGKTIVSKTTGMKFVRIKAATFTMGSPKDEAFRDDDEVQQEVTLTKDFYLGVHEVTRGEFRKFVDDVGYKTEAESDGKGGYGWDAAAKSFKQDPKYTWRDPGLAQADDHPVVNVNWNDAVKYAEWLSRKDGRLYRLPSEAEWEYSCRGGRPISQPFGIGDGISLDSTQANFDGNYPYGKAAKAVYREKTTPVGSFSANAFGLYDMHGNVWEWCGDRYGEYSSDRVTDPSGPSEGSSRVIRGGSWLNFAGICRSAYRGRLVPSYRNAYLGFRLALVPSGR